MGKLYSTLSVAAASVAAAAGLAFSYPGPASAAAVAASQGSARPTSPGLSPLGASGGGCSGYVLIDPSHNFAVAGCISENSSRQIVSDAHWRNAPPFPDECFTHVKMRDDTLGTFQEGDYSGCNADPGQLVVSAISGHHYHTYGWVEVYNLITGSDYIHNIPNSPEQIAG